MPADTARRIESLLRLRILDQLDRMDEPDMADLSDILVTAESLHQLFMQVLPILIHLREDMVTLHDLEDSERDGAAHRISCIGMAVDEGLVRTEIIIERIVHLVCRDGERHRHIACRQSLRRAEDIRGHARMLDRKELARAAKARCDLIIDQEHAVLIAELSEDLGEAMVGINESEIKIIMEERGK